MADQIRHSAFAPEDFPLKARKVLQKHLAFQSGANPLPLDGIYIVWFNFTLGNWKALLSTTLQDGKYYELTHRVDSGMVFVDTYVKINNTEVLDV